MTLRSVGTWASPNKEVQFLIPLPQLNVEKKKKKSFWQPIKPILIHQDLFIFFFKVWIELVMTCAIIFSLVVTDKKDVRERNIYIACQRQRVTACVITMKRWTNADLRRDCERGFGIGNKIENLFNFSYFSLSKKSNGIFLSMPKKRCHFAYWFFRNICSSNGVFYRVFIFN